MQVGVFYYICVHVITVLNAFRVDSLLHWCANYFQSAVFCTYEQVSANLTESSHLSLLNLLIVWPYTQSFQCFQCCT